MQYKDTSQQAFLIIYVRASQSPDSGPGGNSIRTRLHLIFQTHSYHSDLCAVCVEQTLLFYYNKSVVKIVFFLLHIDYNLYNQFYYKYNG